MKLKAVLTFELVVTCEALLIKKNPTGITKRSVPFL